LGIAGVEAQDTEMIRFPSSIHNLTVLIS
jgi:hypothetical protein